MFFKYLRYEYVKNMLQAIFDAANGNNRDGIDIPLGEDENELPNFKYKSGEPGEKKLTAIKAALTEFGSVGLTQRSGGARRRRDALCVERPCANSFWASVEHFCQ